MKKAIKMAIAGIVFVACILVNMLLSELDPNISNGVLLIIYFIGIISFTLFFAIWVYW